MKIHFAQADSKQIPFRDKYFHCVVTSPPYWGLRSYETNVHKSYELGTEPIHDCGAWAVGLPPCGECFVCNIRTVAFEIWRVLRDDGTFWLNLGDSYAGSGGAGEWSKRKAGKQEYAGPRGDNPNRYAKKSGLKPKDLAGVPWRCAFALQADGWTLRSDVIWHKKNTMPESCTDRPTKSHEYLFELSKQPHYYYDHLAIREPVSENTIIRLSQSNLLNQAGSTRAHAGAKSNGPMKAVGNIVPKRLTFDRRGDEPDRPGQTAKQHREGRKKAYTGMRNKRTVWTIGTKPYRGSHFATFPPDLVKPCILAGTSERGACPDCGTPWVEIIKHGYKAPSDEEKIKEMEAKGIPRQKANLYGHNSREPEYYVNEPDTSLGWLPNCDCFDGPWIRDNFQRLLDKGEIPLEDAKEIIDWYSTVETDPCRVLDPFSGSGTTAMVANQLGRAGFGLDLSMEYIELSKQRTGLKALDDWQGGVDASEPVDLGPLFEEIE